MAECVLHILCTEFVYDLCWTSNRVLRLQFTEPYQTSSHKRWLHFLWRLKQGTSWQWCPTVCCSTFLTTHTHLQKLGMEVKWLQSWKVTKGRKISRLICHISQHNNHYQLTPAHSPSGLGQHAHWVWRQQPGHWVFCAVVGGKAPQTLCRQNTNINPLYAFVLYEHTPGLIKCSGHFKARLPNISVCQIAFFYLNISALTLKTCRGHFKLFSWIEQVFSWPNKQMAVASMMKMIFSWCPIESNVIILVAVTALINRFSHQDCACNISHPLTYSLLETFKVGALLKIK